MKVPYYIVNAFSKISFSGNPTGVCILEDWLSTDDLQKIASQTQMAETVFLFPSDSKQWSIRWFSPLVEKDLSGHGTLAAAHILLEEGFSDGNQAFNFSSCGGRLKVEKRTEGILRLEMDILKARSCVASPLLVEGLGAYPDETFVGMDCLCVFSDESIVRELQPEPRLLKRIGSARGIIVTAKSYDSKFDYVTRFFSPRLGVDEDEVTGSIHGLLVPYWFKKLGKVEMRSKQLSPRGTSVICGIEESFVWIEGYADTFLRGEITL
ncbi:MAG: PhzF family phenazine biosynthesis protein [Opitutae bacterium]|nr:PhzF family phenazine biosynthesis protein [Opitutae bacterium]